MTLRMRAALEVACIVAIGGFAPFIVQYMNWKFAGLVLAVAGLTYFAYQLFEIRYDMLKREQDKIVNILKE